MEWLFCFLISVCILLLAIIFAVSVYFGKYKRGRFTTPFRIVFAGVFISVFICLLPINYNILLDVNNSLFKTFLFSIQNTLQVFSLDADNEIIRNNISCPDIWLSNAYSVFFSIIFVLAPVLTFGIILSFFKNVTAYFRYIIHYNGDMYIFSELNEKSLSLGRDIKNNHKRAVIIYTDVFDNNDEVSFEQIEQAKEFHAILFKKDILALNLKIHSPKASIFLFTIGKDETENINQSLKLIESFKERENTRLYNFSTRIDSGLLLANADYGKLKVRRINEVRSIVNRILYDNGEQLFNNARIIAGDEKKITAVMIGLGGHGTEMLKALSWYCQMDGYHVDIHAFDIDDKAEEKFNAIAPELMSKEYNGVKIDGEAEYNIIIHSGFDVNTKSFIDEIYKLVDTTYVFVSLGSDEMNIKNAVELRRVFERMRINPVIQSIIYNSDEKDALIGLKNYNGTPFNIEFIGDIKSSYSENVIMNSELERSALSRHLKWGKEEEFWRYEYNYNSSVASAIHMKARIFCGISGATKKEEELTDKEKETIETLEHRRWNAYMRSEGYIYSGSPEKSSRNDLAKMHNDLVDYSSLLEEEKRKDSRIGTK